MKVAGITIGMVILVMALNTRKSYLKEEVWLEEHPDFVVRVVDLQSSELNFFLKDEQGNHFKNFKTLQSWLSERGHQLLFAMNGGMYTKDLSPQGLYIEKGNVIQEADRKKEGYGNFYLQPNGVFYITNSKEGIVVRTDQLIDYSNIKFATQSGPMLITEGKLHPKFRKGSNNLNIRNGVGILPDRKLLFAMSKKEINFYDFASFFKERGCQNALYLDGFVSRVYLPETGWVQEDGNFGVIIGELK